MTVSISGPFSGHGPVVVPITPAGGPRVRETRVAITDDQAARLRAMVEAMQGRRHAPAPPVPVVSRGVPAPGPSLTGARARGEDAPSHRHARVVTIASGKGGVGKSSTAVNLAIALVQLGRRTTLLDADLGMANADVLCGLTPTRRLEQFVGVTDSPPGVPARRTMADLAVEAPGGFRLIPGSVGVARMTELSAEERQRLLAALAELDQGTDVIVVDTGAGLGREVISFSRAADLSVVIATPEPTSISDAYALIKCILLGGEAKARGLRPPVPADESTPRVVLVVNQAADQHEAAAVHARMGAVCQRFLGYRLPMLGWIVQDARVGAAVRKRRPLLLDSPSSPAAGALRTLAGHVSRELKLDARPTGPQRPGGLSGLLSRLLRGG